MEFLQITGFNTKKKRKNQQEIKSENLKVVITAMQLFLYVNTGNSLINPGLKKYSRSFS